MNREQGKGRPQGQIAIVGALRKWHRPLWVVVLLVAVGLLAQTLAQSQTAGLFCYSAPNQPLQCFDTLGKTEQAMRAAPDNTVVGPLLVQDAPEIDAVAQTANYVYRVNDQPASVLNGPSYFQTNSSDIVSGGFGCIPGADPNLPNWCASEDDLIARVMTHLRTAKPQCSFTGQQLATDRVPPYAEVDDNWISGLSYGDVEYGAKVFNTTRTCAGVTTVLTFRIYMKETFQCPFGFTRLYDDIPNDGVNEVTLPILCSYAPARRITGPIQQCAACPGSRNPVYPATGEKQRQEEDFEFAGQTFTRHYRSLRQFRNHRQFAVGWSHTWSDRIFTTFGATSPVALIDAAGNYERFVVLDATRYRGENSVDRIIEKINANGIGWRLREADGEVREFDTSGYLIAVRHPDDPLNDIVLAYNSKRSISTITDAQGRMLRFEYANHLLQRIVLPDGTAMTYGYDTHANLTEAMYPGGAVRRYHYNEAGLAGSADQRHALTGITAEDGQRFASFGYDARGRTTSSRVLGTPNELTTVEYPTDNTATIQTAEGDSRAYNITPGVYRRIATATDSVGTEGQTFYPDGRLQTQTDKRNTVTRYEYTADYLSATIHAEGTPEQRREETTRNPTTRRITEQRTLDAAGVLKAKTNWSYNARNQIISVTATDPDTSATRTTAMTYCEAQDVSDGTCPLVGLLTKIDGPLAGSTDVTRFTYRMADEATCATAPTTCPYRKGDLWKTTNALDHVSEVLRADGAGRVLSVRDANGIVTDMTYDARGRLTASKVRGSDDSIDADDQISRIEYGANGLVSRVIPPGGAYSQFEYDAGQRLTKITDAAGNTMRFTLDAAGERVKEDTQDASGTLLRTLSRTYDTLGRLWTQADAQHRATSFEYDKDDNLQLVTDALGRKTGQTYDPLGRLKTTLEDVDGIAAQTQYRYDALDQLTRIIDPNGLPTAYTYNGFGEVLTLDSPDTGIAMSTYDAAGNLKTRTDARGITATYGYDLLNRLTSASFPDTSRNASFAYDTAPAECPNGERYATGRLTTMTDASGATGYCYDRFGNLTRKLQITQGRTYALRYDYAPRAGRTGSDYLLRPRAPTGHLMGMTYPDGAQVKIGRNQLRQATDLTITLANGQTKTLLGGAAYYPFGPVGQWTYGNGRTLQRSLNQNYQPGYVQDSAAGGISEGYWFDAAGNLESLRRADQQDPAKRKYEYDGLDRLTHVRDGASNALLQHYVYDKTGNRSSRTDGATTTAYTYAVDKHRLMQVGAQHRAYDAAGNTTRIGGAAQAAASQPTASPIKTSNTIKPQARPRGLRAEALSRKAAKSKPAPQRRGVANANRLPTTGASVSATVAPQAPQAPQALTPTTVREFVYDDTDRMRQVKHDGVVAMNYLYNGLGERVYKSGSGQTVTTIYDEDGHWIGDYDANGQPIQQAIWLDDLPVGLLVGAGANQKLFYIEADALGTPRVVIDPDRNVAVWRWDLANEAFGDSAPNEDPDADGVAFVFDMRFPGQRYDSATGLNYNYYRDYEAGTGRYAESDPIGLDGGMSTYGYADGSPLINGDPEGLMAGKVAGYLVPRLLPGIGLRLGATHAVRQVGTRALRAEIKRRAERRVARIAAQGAHRKVASACNGRIPVVKGESGRFSELASRGVKGDKLTPHHMPQVAAHYTTRAEGGALMMPEVQHALTRTYGYRGALTARNEVGMAFRDVFARDIRDVRRIAGVEYNQGLRNLIEYYRTNFPGLIGKP